MARIPLHAVGPITTVQRVVADVRDEDVASRSPVQGIASGRADDELRRIWIMRGHAAEHAAMAVVQGEDVILDVVGVRVAQDDVGKGRLFDLLKEEIEEGRSYYQSRVDPEVARSTNYFNEALVDVLVRPGGRIPSKAW